MTVIVASLIIALLLALAAHVRVSRLRRYVRHLRTLERLDHCVARRCC